MMNKKLIALFVAVATIGSVSTNCLADGFLGNLGKATGGLVEDTGRTFGNVGTRLTTGESIREIEERHDIERANREAELRARQQKSQERYENRRYYNNKD
jgi:hypothetical protein